MQILCSRKIIHLLDMLCKPRMFTPLPDIKIHIFFFLDIFKVDHCNIVYNSKIL